MQYSSRRKFKTVNSLREATTNLGIPLTGKPLGLFTSEDFNNAKYNKSWVIGIDVKCFTPGRIKRLHSNSFNCLSLEQFNKELHRLNSDAGTKIENYYLYRLYNS